MRTLVPTAVLLSLIPFSLYASARSNSGGLPERVTELEAQVEVLTSALQEAQEILQFMRVETEIIDGLVPPHLIIEGANVHVRSGYGSTVEGCLSRDPDFPNCESLTGLGNLIVGYNERFPARGLPVELRTGSHNLVVGRYHSYSSFAGFVAGDSNWIIGANATVTGGQSNWASGKYSSVSGGHRNTASGKYSSVSGGEDREAPDENNWAAGDLFKPN
jgi:hypothetical protein